VAGFDISNGKAKPLTTKDTKEHKGDPEKQNLPRINTDYTEQKSDRDIGASGDRKSTTHHLIYAGRKGWGTGVNLASM